MPNIGIYARVSTEDQDVRRQLQEAQNWVRDEYPDASIERYPDVISGATDVRGEEYERLWTDIAAGDLDLVVVHELSRISRLGAGAIHEFLQHCLDNETSVKDLEVGLEISLDDDLVDRAVSQLIAGVMGDLARIEHRQKLRRIKSGIQAAQEAGKWTGRPPRGFYVGEDDQRLHVKDVEFMDTRRALERVLAGEPQEEVAEATGIPASTLRSILDDQDRLQMYFYGEAADDRKQAALDELGDLEPPDVGEAEDADDLVDRVAQLEETVAELQERQ